MQKGIIVVAKLCEDVGLKVTVSARTLDIEVCSACTATRKIRNVHHYVIVVCGNCAEEGSLREPPVFFGSYFSQQVTRKDEGEESEDRFKRCLPFRLSASPRKER